MNEENKAKAENEETNFSRQVGAQAAQAEGSAEPKRASGSAWVCPG